MIIKVITIDYNKKDFLGEKKITRCTVINGRGVIYPHNNPAVIAYDLFFI